MGEDHGLPVKKRKSPQDLTDYDHNQQTLRKVVLYNFIMRQRLFFSILLAIFVSFFGANQSSAANEIKTPSVSVAGLEATASWEIKSKVRNTTYEIELTDKSKNKNNTTKFRSTKPTFTFSKLKPWNEYSVKVRGKVGSRVYAWSKPKTFTSTQAAISEVFATNVSYQTASISWASVSGATGYKIYVDSKPFAVTLGTSYDFKNLKIGSDYAITVSAIKGSLEGAISQESTLRTQKAAPENLINTSLTNTTAKFEWTAIPGVDDYEIYIDEKFTERVKTTSYELKNQKPGAVVVFRVNGRFGDDRTESNATKVAFLREIPTSLKIVEATTTSLKLEWVGSKNFAKYYVYMNSLRVATTTTTTYLAKDLKQGQKVTFYVTGVEGETESAASESLDSNTQVETPSAPTVTVNNAVSATVSWPKDSSAQNFIVTIIDGVKGATFVTNKVAGSATSSQITGLAPGSNYSATIAIDYGTVTTSTSAATAFTTTRPSPTGLSVSGITTTGATLTWDAVAGALRYEYSRDALAAVNVGNAQSVVLTSLSPGVTYSVRVRSVFTAEVTPTTNVSDFSTAVTFTTLPDISARPTALNAPTITISSPYSSATAIVGATLSTSVNSTLFTSLPAPSSYAYQWQRSYDGANTWNNIEGATSSSYVLVESDYGFRVRVSVTATNTNGTSIGNPSSATAAVGSIANIQIPIVRGTLVVGQILSATQGTWYSKDPLSYTYAWLRNGSAITDATAATYTLVDADIGKEISVKVTARSSLGSLDATSAVRGSVPAILSTAAPVISGTLRSAETLTTTNGTWLNSPTSYSYQWEQSSDGVLWDAISGATSQTYVLASAQVGKFVRVQVRATKSTYTEVIYSAATTAITGTVTGLVISNTSAPFLSGVWAEGSTLTTSTGSWSASGTFTYKWQISSDGSSWSDISGATTSSYTIVSGDARKFIRSVVTITSSTGAGTAYSGATSKVGAPYNTATPAVTGTVRVGSVQTTTNGTWSNSPSTYTYQWQSSSNGISWVNIASATSQTYTPTFAQANVRIRVIVTAANSLSDTSTATSNVVSGFLPPEATSIPVVSGTATAGQTLTVTDPGTWAGSPSAGDYAYQWQRSTDGVTWTNISGGTGSTYVLVAGDAGYQIRAQVSLSTNAGTSVAYSLATSAVAPS